MNSFINSSNGIEVLIEYDPTNKFMHIHPKTIGYALGYIPNWLADPRFIDDSIVECIDKNYQHGGGWHNFDGFTHEGNGVLSYPDDPDLYPLAKYERTTNCKKEVAYQYLHGWFCSMNDDGSIRVARID